MIIPRFVLERLAKTEVTAILVALLCMLSPVAGRPRTGREEYCGVDARPHEEGVCGDALTRARNNLCNLLRAEYPDIYNRNRRRSVTDLLNYPVGAFARMDLLGKAEDVDAEERALVEGNVPFRQTRASETMEEDTRTLQKRGMVCECCFNKCKPSQLARYC